MPPASRPASSPPRPAARRRVLVAGATGYAGRHVVEELKDRGHWVRALTRDAKRLAAPGAFLAPAVRDADEVFEGQVLKPETLHGLCRGIDVVVSALGKTRQKDRHTSWDVDYRGNRILLDAALRDGVRAFVYVAGIADPRAGKLTTYRAHEAFIRDLKASGLAWSVVRPTGYFSDMTEFLEMARRGRVYLVGPGTTRMNPIHGADVASVCADSAERPGGERTIGGPEILTWNETAAVAARAAGGEARIVHVPGPILSAGAWALRPFNQVVADLLAFLVIASRHDEVGERVGTHRLEDFYREYLKAGSRPGGGV